MSVYRGRSVDEVIPQIQRDLGSDAIIVRRREGLTGGILGFFQHPFVEIEALPGAPGIDVYDEPQSVAPVPTPPQVQVQPQAPPPAFAPAPTPQPPQAPVYRPAPPAVPPPPSQGPPPQAPPLQAPAPTAPAATTPSSPPASPAPFYAREPPVAPAATGSAYVTAHLAALARAGPRQPLAERRRESLPRP